MLIRLENVTNIANDDKRNNVLATSISIIVIGMVLIPFLILGDEYIFTVHDYLDSTPGYVHIMKKLPLIPSYQDSSGIMGDMPAFYFFPEFTAYRFLHYYFDFVFADFLNRAFAVIIGFFSTKYLLDIIFRKYLPHSISILIATAYAVSPVFPKWSLGFSILPLLIAKLFIYWNNGNRKVTWRMLPFLLVGIMGAFASLGLFVCVVWFIALVIYLLRYKKINIPMLLGLLLMGISYGVADAYLFEMALSGIETNRLLFKPEELEPGLRGISHAFRSFRLVLTHGQYHAAPIVNAMAIFCGLAGIKAYLLYRRQLLSQDEILVGRYLLKLFSVICFFAMLYALDSVGLLGKLFSQIIPLLGGFNFGRMVYINNILWYLLFSGIVSMIIIHYKRTGVALMIVLLQLLCVLSGEREYQDTRNNLFQSIVPTYYEERLYKEHNRVTYHQFIDKEFWNHVKNCIQYRNEKVVSVGFHPSITMANGFNTIDGYLPLHPMNYQKAFREIIAPTLERYDSLREYYDTWGGRMYVYADNTRNTNVAKDKPVEYKALYINTDAFAKQGGKYVLSRYVLTNAADIQLEMITECDNPGSIYHIFVYQVAEDNK